MRPGNRQGYRCPHKLLTGIFLLLVVPAQAVVINEVHYNPPEGRDLEFVELHNPSGEEIALAGWSFTRGIRFEFPATAVLPARGYVVVCRNREALQRRFGLVPDLLHGDHFSSLDNGGEEIVLLDAAGRLVDAVDYDNLPPWDTDADGRGPSLERLCVSFDSTHPANWVAEAGTDPTPLAPSHHSQCPPPPLPPPVVAINEIYYHPLRERDADEEFVELVNNSERPVDLQGYSFSNGIDFRFEESTVLEPGGHIVVCRNREAFQAAHQVENVVGDFAGILSNDGERLTLVDAENRLVDSVRYRDHGEWPVAADGLGRSLEKIVPTAVSDDPASWIESQVGDLDQWQTETTGGRATSSKLFVYADGEAEFLLDNVSLVHAAEPNVNLLPNGAFEEGVEGWEMNGNHADSGWQSDGGPDGGGALRLVANGAGRGSTQGISTETVVELDRSTDVTYIVSFDYRHLTGHFGLTVRLSGSSSTRGIFFRLGQGAVVTPGEANGALRESLPPFASHLGRHPQEPRSDDTTWISARVRGGEVSRVSLTFSVNGGEPSTLEMRDDGQSGDGTRGDRVYGAGVPPQPHNSIVTFQIAAASSAGNVRVFPPETDPTGAHGYYVNDNQPESVLPVYTILLDHLSPLAPRSLIARLNCSTYRNASFAHKGDLFYNVGIRHRGQSVCGSSIIKRFLKLRFLRGKEFQDQRKLNLQSLWTDKSLIREYMAWQSFRDIGNPYCREEFVRLHVNGQYFGLYAELEHAGKRFLTRNGLNDEGNLYKATASREEANGTYEKKTNEDGDFSDLRDFLNAMHRTSGAALKDFFSERTDEDKIIDYQVAQILTNNRDYPHKNHYLYHDTERGKWMPITWDMDLTFGKRWDGNFGGVLNDLMDNPGINPWYTTRVDGGLGNHLMDKFFFQAGTWYRRAYVVRLWDAIQEKYTLDFFDREIAFLHDFLWDEQLEDINTWGRSPPTANDRAAPAEFEPNLDRVRNHIRVRRGYLLNYLGSRERFNGHPRLKITEVMYNPPGDSEEAEFLELWNNTGEDIDISGWTIVGLGTVEDSGERQEFVFPKGAVILADEVFVVAKNRAVFFEKHNANLRVFGPYPGNLSNAGEELRVKDNGPGFPATVDFLRYGTRPPWPVRADGLGYSLELTAVHADRDNDLPEYWRSSLLPGGTPGTIADLSEEPVFFRRGECDGDGTVSITDAVTILLLLFRGGDEPSCFEGCDVDADRAVTVSDAVFLLRSFFVPGAATIPWPGPDGCEELQSGFCESSNCTPLE